VCVVGRALELARSSHNQISFTPSLLLPVSVEKNYVQIITYGAAYEGQFWI
jgi:hypothetical protein